MYLRRCLTFSLSPPSATVFVASTLTSKSDSLIPGKPVPRLFALGCSCRHSARKSSPTDPRPRNMFDGELQWIKSTYNMAGATSYLPRGDESQVHTGDPFRRAGSSLPLVVRSLSFALAAMHVGFAPHFRKVCQEIVPDSVHPKQEDEGRDDREMCTHAVVFAVKCCHVVSQAT